MAFSRVGLKRQSIVLAYTVLVRELCWEFIVGWYSLLSPTFWHRRAYLSTATTDLPDWGQAAQLALQAILPQLLLFLFLLELERIRPLALSYGIHIQLSRCKM